MRSPWCSSFFKSDPDQINVVLADQSIPVLDPENATIRSVLSLCWSNCLG